MKIYKDILDELKQLNESLKSIDKKIAKIEYNFIDLPKYLNNLKKSESNE